LQDGLLQRPRTHLAHIRSYRQRGRRPAQLEAHSTLHDRANDIQWTEDYCEDTMRDYDMSPGRITCVGANMDVGKTERLMQQVEELGGI
jgi:hypothetical protein